MPALVDTTIRLLGQDPLAERIPTSDLLRVHIELSAETGLQPWAVQERIPLTR